MDAFSYLSVLLSIIIGLAITQVLQGYRALLLNRGKVKLYFPTLAWSVIVLIMATQSWWASFGLADRRDWSFFSFAAILLQTIELYLIAGVVLPDIPADEAIDLKAHYFRELTPLQSLLIAMLATSLGKEWLLEGRIATPSNLAFHLGFVAMAGLALAIRKPRFHEILTGVVLLAIIAYIALLFARL